MTLLQHHVVACHLTAVTTFGLGLFVFLKEPKRRLNQVFAFYSLSIAWWSFMEGFLARSTDQLTANRFFFWEWFGVSFIAPSFLHTVLLLTEEHRKNLWTLVRIGYASGIIVVFLNLFTNWVLLAPRPIAYANFLGRLAPFGFYQLIVFLLLVNVGLWKLAHSCQAERGQKKTQLKYLFWSSVIGYIGGSPDWALTFGIYIPWFNPFGIYGVPFYSIATTYAILQHRLFDINVIIRKSLVYSLLVTALTVGYFGFMYVVEWLFRTTLGYQSVWLSIATFALMALLFQPLKLGTQRVIDFLFFRAPREEMVKRVERLEKETQQTEKLKAVATLATGLCHELRNPLQVIQTHAEFLPERYDDPQFRERCSEAMRTEIERINGLLKELMEFAKPKPPSLQLVEPHKILDSTLDLLSNEFVVHQIHLEKRYEANGVKITADPDQLRQVVLNLVLNALQAIGEEGTITVTTRQENGWFSFDISDTGPGIDPAVLPKLFEPFNTTKATGTGLGLSISHSIIREHRGKISAQSQSGHGTVFKVFLPVA